MTVSRNREPKIVLDGFPGGLNELSDPTHLSPGELAAVKNMDVRDGRTLSSRLGQAGEHNRAYQAIGYPVTRLHRYRSLAGEKRLLLASGGKLYADTHDNRKYDEIVSVPGTLALQQFYDAVLIASDQYELSVWRPDVGVVRPNMRPPIPPFFWGGSGPTGLTGGGALSDAMYNYRFTFDISAGATFLGETGTLQFNLSPLGDVFYFVQVDFSAGTGNDNIVQFKRPSDVTVNSIPSYVAAINLYRSPALTALPGSPEYDVLEDFELFWIGAIDMDDLRAAAAGATVFEDNGLPLGKQIRKRPLAVPPRAKRMAMHKGRLWMASPTLDYLGDGTWQYEPDLVAFSAFEANGTEPFVFFAESTLAVGAGEPAEMTGIRSWQNDALIVWKPNTIRGIVGGDTELDFGIPDLAVRLIDASIGCVAPETIVDVESGIGFLSHRGPYIWDGTVPRPLASHRVKKTINAIPHVRRPHVAAVYHSKEKEFCLFVSQPGNAYNRYVLRYNFLTRSWTRDEIARGVGVAIEVRDEDVVPYVLWGVDDSPLTVLATTPAVQRAERGFLEGIDIPVTGDSHKIDFLADFGFLDDGLPWLEKTFKEIIVEATSQVPLTLDIVIDNKFDSRVTGQSLVLPVPVAEGTLIWGAGNWGESVWGGAWGSESLGPGYTQRALTRDLGTLPKGKSIRPIISGVNTYEPVEIHSITILYQAEER